ncbi:MAG: flavohemoglobin expression-modulating QEGLA motif protein [Planctomycetes bacterium]|nr:flavohemoglobin expression-modulating QEGLA motif protein [Planctomycetota bacterium]
MSTSSPKPSGSSLAARVIAELNGERPVRLELPGGGRLHLDRRLPFVCVYRRTANDADDNGTEELVTCEACYMIIPAEPRAASKALHLLRAVVQNLADHFGSFLLIETWSAPIEEAHESAIQLNGDSDAVRPRFEIAAPSSRIPRSTIEALSKSLGKDMLPFGGTRVVLGPYREMAPSGRKPLLRMSELKEWNCFSLGVVARPVYRNEATHELYPAVLRSIRHHVHSALEQAYFAFSHKRTSLRTPHYHALGGRTVGQSVLDIDRQLVEIARSFDLLLQATPVNAEAAWREFRRARFGKPPTFFYRPLAIDPALLKRQLYLIPVERIEDPTLSYLFRQKQEELDRQITLLSDVDTPRFLPESLQIYGGVSDWLLNHAVELLDQVPARSRDEPVKQQLDATEFAQRAQQELGYYQQQCADFCATVSVRDDMYAGLMVSGDQLLIGGKFRVPRRRVEALLQHEVGTHLVTRYNGHHQLFQQLEVGLAGYDGLQEGLAVLSEYLVGGLSRARMRILAARVVAARQLLDGASFVDTFRTLDRNYEFSKRTAYTIAMRIYRGGGLTKDAVYLRGLLQILRYLREGGDLEPLFVGKVASAHLPLIFELSQRQVIKPPVLRPRYLESLEAQEKLERLREGMKLMELLQK